MAQGVVIGAALAVLAAGLVYGLRRTGAGPSPPEPTGPAAGVRSAPTAGSAASAHEATTSTAGQTTTAPTSTPTDPGPRVWPLGCIAANRPCGIGCCIWDRGCEPGSCDEPLAAGEQWDLRLAKVAVWPFGDQSKLAPLKGADVWLRFGKDAVRRPLFGDRPLRVTSAELGGAFGGWIQPNAPGRPPLVEIAPRAPAEGRKRLVVCRGVHLSVDVGGFTYWLWISVLPVGEARPELCPKARP
jgi:hypothetical protein